MTRTKAILAVVAVGIGAAAAVAGALVWRSEVPALASPPTVDPDLIVAGERLAYLGNCAGCHTAPGGAALAGGLPIETPFGLIYTTNITPDSETGIGAWSLEAYRRAMRDGVDRRGRHLYPVFPYDHFTRMTDDDIAALYAWNMSREPVRAAVPDNALRFPYGLRPLLAGWKLLYLRPGAYSPDPARNEDWNHGAYLVAGLGHCGACHTPRDALGGPQRGAAFAGGEAEGWTAPALTVANPAPVPWTAESLHRYLRDGADPAHGVAAGPMASVVRALGQVPEDDIHAIAVYLADAMARDGGDEAAGSVGYGRVRAALPMEIPPMGSPTPVNGGALYAGACAACHHAGGPRPSGLLPDMPLVTSIHAATPDNLIQVVLFGIGQDEGRTGAYMPGFAETFDDVELAALIAHLRTLAPGRPAWEGLETAIDELRERGPVGGTGGGPLEGYSIARQP